MQTTTPAAPHGFNEFWNACSRKQGHAEAIAAWRRLNPSPALASAIAQAAAAQYGNGTPPQFQPSAARWLRERRWEDADASSRQILPPIVPRVPHACPCAQALQSSRQSPAHASLNPPGEAFALRFARLVQKALRRFGIFVSWAPSSGEIGCVDSTSLATGTGAHPSQRRCNTPARCE